MGERVRPAFFLPRWSVAQLVVSRTFVPAMRASLALLFVGFVVSACAPRLSPPYRDYEVREAITASDLTARLRAAITEAGWEIAPSAVPAVVSTTPRRVEAGLLSSTDAALDLVPLDGGFVRVYVRAETRSFLGGRSKVYALSPALRGDLLRSLSDALASRGLVALGTPRDRDEDATE